MGAQYVRAIMGTIYGLTDTYCEKLSSLMGDGSFSAKLFYEAKHPNFFQIV
jgi:hypothetical protein